MPTQIVHIIDHQTTNNLHCIIVKLTSVFHKFASLTTQNTFCLGYLSFVIMFILLYI